MEATNQGVSIVDRLNTYLSPEPAQEPVQDQEVQEERIEQLEEVVEEAVEAQAEPQESEEGVEEEGESFDLSVLADSLGISVDQLDVDEDGHVIAIPKIKGEKSKAKFADLLKSYQLEGVLNKKDTELAEKLKQADQRLNEIDQRAQQKLSQLDDTLRIAYADLTHEFNRINWQELEQDDPDQYLMKRAKFQERNQMLQHAYNQLNQERQELMKKQYDDAISRNSQRLVEVIPSWADNDVAQKEWSEIASYATKNGFTSEEVSNIIDYRMVDSLRKAMLWDRIQSSKPEVTKKVKKAPKFVKSGQAPSQSDNQVTELNKLKSQIKKTGGGKGTVAAYLRKKGIA